jgi:hypothetical protein
MVQQLVELVHLLSKRYNDDVFGCNNDLFEFKPALINMVQASQFCGKACQDVSSHLQYFLEICSTFNVKEVA